MSGDDSGAGGKMIRRSRTWEQHERQQSGRGTAHEPGELTELTDDDPGPPGIEVALQVIGAVSLAGGLLGGMIALKAEDIAGAVAMVLAGVVSAVSVIWMATVLRMLREIRDALNRRG